jgi:shikimate kinase
MSPVVVLVGPMGVGKSTVGRLLAERLSVGYRDTDDDIVAEQGRAIAEIFVDEGEPAFRAIEKAAVRRALTEHDGVLALGGGSILDENTRALLAGQRVLYLSMDVEEAVKRTGLNAVHAEDLPARWGCPSRESRVPCAAPSRSATSACHWIRCPCPATSSGAARSASCGRPTSRTGGPAPAPATFHCWLLLPAASRSRLPAGAQRPDTPRSRPPLGMRKATR